MLSTQKFIGKYIYRVEKIESTNSEMLQHPEKYQNGSVLISKCQLAGRGRAGRHWLSNEGGLYMSMILKNTGAPSAFLPFVLLSALAVARTLKSYVPDEIKIKWPNDVYVNSKKICGILAESCIKGNSFVLVIGVGININNSVQHHLDLRHPAVSLKDLLSDPPDRELVMTDLLQELDVLYSDFLQGAFPKYLSELDQLLFSRGKPLQLNVNGITRELTPVRFHSDAALICLENGREIRVYLGEF